MSCQHEDAVQPGKVQFSFSNKSSANVSGRKQTDAIPDGASLVVSLSKSNGDTVFTWKTMSLLKIGDQFITDPLPLPPGSYVVNDFMIRSSTNTLLFIAPKDGSPLASLVTKPLPISFTVTGNAVVNTEVEVVSADHKNPADFGYAAFPIKVIPSSGFSVSAFVVDEKGQTQLTSAKAYVLHGNDTLLMQNLSARVNDVTWNRGDNNQFSLVIIKDGYGRYEKKFSLDSMNTQLNGKPLSIVLAPAFTMIWKPFTAGKALSLHLGGVEGKSVTIDWGDGIIQHWALHNPDSAVTTVEHVYEQRNKYFMTITGDLTGVNNVEFYDEDMTIDTLTLTHLPDLTAFGLGFAGPYLGKSIDFSHNPKLAYLSLDYSHLKFTSLDLSKNPALTFVDLDYSTLSTAVINQVIDDMFESIARNNIHNGTLSLIAKGMTWPDMVGPPSPDELNKLNVIIQDYGWKVYPISQP